jgi:hypothetical protein
MSDPAILILIGGGLLATLLGYVSMRMARKRRHLVDTPTSKTAGVFIGDVEVSGTAETPSPLTSHLAEMRCVYYSWSVEEHWRRTVVESYTDQKGNRRTRTRIETGWETVDSGSESVPFYVVDDTGHILVRPDGMALEGLEVFSQQCTPRHSLYYGKGPRRSVADSTEERLFVERAIPLHAKVFVAGAARERQDVVAAEIAHSPQARFSIVTTGTEASLASGYSVKAWVAGVFGAVFAVAGGLIYAAAWKSQQQQVILWGAGAFAAYLLILLGLWNIMTFNTLLALRQRVRRGWANIDVELKRRADLIPNLAEAVKGVRGHEHETQELLARMRAQFAIAPQAVRDGATGVEGLASSVVALAERYPALKASENFLALQQELTRTESRIALARTYYNGMVTGFNARIAGFPDSVLASIGGLRPFAFFEASGLEREAVQVDFAR